MIDDLAVGKAATFFTIQTHLTDRAVTSLFTTLRSNYDVTANNHFRHVRVTRGNTRWSAICFSYETTPTFLDETAGVTDTICGYLMLVEYQDHVAVFASRLALPASFKTTHFAPVPTDNVEGAIATADAVFQKMRMRNMSVSPYAMRNKTLEASDLANVVGPAGSRRYAPQAYTVNANGVSRTATPRSGRIAERSDRVGHTELIDFAVGVIDVLRVAPVGVSPFIRTFARPMSLAAALAASQPVTLAMDTNRLRDAVSGDDAAYRLVHAVQPAVELSSAELTQLLADLDQPMVIQGNTRRRIATLEGTVEEAASININTNRIALRSLLLGIAPLVDVESLDFAPGADPGRRGLREFIDAEDAFIVLFGDVRLAYIDGQVFRDETLLDGGAAFLRYLHAEPSLQTVTSEKGDFAATQTAFDATSSFGAIVDHIAATDTVLICDDLGDEWADFIGIREDGGLTHISFYHAKHGDLTLGASAFHVSVSQAMKNLGNMTFPQERMAAKVRTWGTTYNAAGQRTQIARIIRVGAVTLPDAIERARTAPEGIRRAVIVTSSLSKQVVADAFTAIQNGGRPEPSFVQLYWLLQSFFSACAEVGAAGSVVCQP